MGPLMKLLYTYAQETYIRAYLSMDEEYEKSQKCAEKQETYLRTILTPDGTSRLDSLLDEQSIAYTTQMEAAFQAGFRMAIELAR